MKKVDELYLWENKGYNDSSELLGYEWNSVLVFDYV